MLAANKYPKETIDACRARIEAQLAAYQPLAGNDAFEALFLGNLVIVLDASFMHRSRTIEGKDGNPLNEVRMISSSLLQNGGVMTIDKTIKYIPAKSVLGIAPGDEIRLTLAQFVSLSQAYFVAIEATFS